MLQAQAKFYVDNLYVRKSPPNDILYNCLCENVHDTLGLKLYVTYTSDITNAATGFELVRTMFPHRHPQTPPERIREYSYPDMINMEQDIAKRWGIGGDFRYIRKLCVDSSETPPL